MKKLKLFVSKIFFMACIAFVSLALITACGNDDTDYDEQIVGKWEVQNIHYTVDDHTAGTHNEYTVNATDSIYIGYDTVEFNADGTTRWHMNDRYVQQGMFPYSYWDFNWYIKGDSLIVWFESKEHRWVTFEIKELDNKNLVVEKYYNNPEEYSHHHLEGTDRYTFKRLK
ncbi:MAG: hypothetical protein J6X86_04100 [Bacteroidales bacterium]|nr:hypothetical protein [Bacteroidales bacterium]